MIENRQSNESIIRCEQDAAWKEILDCYFKEFVDFCLPQLSELIDWSKPWVSLDKEFQALVKQSETGMLLLDKLSRVYLKNGKEQWVLVHIEIQGKKDKYFPERMFLYECRIYDKYRQAVLGCAVLTDSNPVWRPQSFNISVLPGSSLNAEFFVIKLIDYLGRESELEPLTNPFADIILVQLAAISLKGKPDKQRKRVKFSLTRRWYDKGYSREKVLNLYKFIDWVIGLPRELEIEYQENVYALEGEKKMAYITSAERFGMERGILKGRQEGRQEAGIILEKIKQDIDVQIISQETGVSPEEIEVLKKILVTPALKTI